jgi:hypothetical protein
MSVRDGSFEPIAVFCGLIAAATVPAVFLAMQMSPGRSFDLPGIAGWFGVFYFYALGFVLLFGLPAFFVLRPFRPGHWWSVMAVGGLLGMGASWLLPGRNSAFAVLMSCGLGSASALVFWLIWVGSLPKVRSTQDDRL